MPPSPSTPDVDFSRRVAPADLPERLDEPCSCVDLQACLSDLAQVNTLTFGARPTLRWLQRNWLDPSARNPSGESLRIVDVGCGGGDMLRRIERWADRRGIPVQLTGVDLNPDTIQIARNWAPEGSGIEWIAGDVFTYDQPVDIVLSSLLMHHLAEPDIVGLLEWMERTALRGWYINDLVREQTPYKVFGLAAKALRWHKMVQHDGPVSFRRAFREDDWFRMLNAAHIDASQITMRRWTPGRLCVGRVR